MARKYLKSAEKYDMNLWSFRIEVSILQPMGFLESFLTVTLMYTAAWSDVMMFPIEQETTDSINCFGAKKKKRIVYSCETLVRTWEKGGFFSHSVLSTSTYPKSSQRPVICFDCFDGAKAPRGNLSTKGFKRQLKSPPTTAFPTARSDNFAKASVKKLGGWHGGQ